MTKADIWMPLYIGDYLADTIGLTLAQHGAYLLLIFAYWKNGGPLPERDCNRVISVLLTDEGEKVSTFFKIKGGKWHHKRVDAELKKANALKTAKSRAGKKGMAKRWADNTAITEGITKHNPSPSPSHSDKEAYNKGEPKLSNGEWELTKGFEEQLDGQWTNDAGKWVNRIKETPKLSERVLAELCSAAKEGRINTTPAQYAEQIWKEFSS